MVCAGDGWRPDHHDHDCHFYGGEWRRLQLLWDRLPLVHRSRAVNGMAPASPVRPAAVASQYLLTLIDTVEVSPEAWTGPAAGHRAEFGYQHLEAVWGGSIARNGLRAEFGGVGGR